MPQNGQSFSLVLDVSEEILTLVRQSTQTPDSASVAISIALGRICAVYDLSLPVLIEIIRFSYAETKQAS